MKQAADQACHELIRIDMLYGGISFSDSFFMGKRVPRPISSMANADFNYAPFITALVEQYPNAGGR